LAGGAAVSSQNQPIELQVQLSADDYSRYFAAVGKRQSTWIDFSIYAGAFFVAIPVALAARAVAALETSNPVAIELAGRCSLFAFFAGLITLGLALSIMRRRAIAATLSGTPNAFDSKTVVLDENAVAITGKLSQVRWTWPAISRVTAERDLVLLWIGPQNAVVIPDRAFANTEARDSAIAFAHSMIHQASGPG
jgi:YcxB-like protein